MPSFGLYSEMKIQLTLLYIFNVFPIDYSSISDEVKERICDGTVLDTVSQGPVKFSIWVSFAEIYNEYVYDLLDPTPPGKGKKRPVLKLGDDKKGNPYVKGAILISSCLVMGSHPCVF